MRVGSFTGGDPPTAPLQALRPAMTTSAMEVKRLANTVVFRVISRDSTHERQTRTYRLSICAKSGGFIAVQRTLRYDGGSAATSGTPCRRQKPADCRIASPNFQGDAYHSCVRSF